MEESRELSQQMFDHPYNEFNYLTNQELRQQLLDKNKGDNFMEYIDKHQSKLFRQPMKLKLVNSSLDSPLDKSMSNDLIRLVSNNRRHTIQSSKSIANLPSLTNKIDSSKQTFHNNQTHSNKKHDHAEHHVKTTILNLSPLSISASSVTTGGLNSAANSSSSSNSSSINSLINNSNKNKLKLDQVATNLASEVGSITNTAVNTIQTDLKSVETSEVENVSNAKYHNNFTMKQPQQNIQFNCTFESLI